MARKVMVGVIHLPTTSFSNGISISCKLIVSQGLPVSRWDPHGSDGGCCCRGQILQQYKQNRTPQFKRKGFTSLPGYPYCVSLLQKKTLSFFLHWCLGVKWWCKYFLFRFVTIASRLRVLRGLWFKTCHLLKDLTFFPQAKHFLKPSGFL